MKLSVISARSRNVTSLGGDQVTLKRSLHMHTSITATPLTSHEVIVKTIGATTTRTGLSVHAELDQATYPTGIKIPDQQMKALQDNGTLLRHTFHGEWNYTLRAQPDTPDPE